MAKRFTDTQKWMDPWFYSLSPNEKLFWSLLVDNCDHAGVWKVNWPMASNLTGANLDEFEIMQKFAGRINIIKEDLWFVPSFIKFQYPSKLNPEVNKAHLGVVKILKNHKIDLSPYLAPSKGLARGSGIGIGIGIGNGIGNKGGAGGKNSGS